MFKETGLAWNHFCNFWNFAISFGIFNEFCTLTKHLEGKEVIFMWFSINGFLSVSLQALCINVQSNDVCETLALVFCGADVNCDTGIPEFPTPAALALHHGQKLQVEFLTQNRNIGQFQDEGVGLNCGWSSCIKWRRGFNILLLTLQRFQGQKSNWPCTQSTTWPRLPSHTTASFLRPPLWLVQSQSGRIKKVSQSQSLNSSIKPTEETIYRDAFPVAC